MSCSDFVADFLTIIRNACKARKDKITVHASNLTVHIAEILKEEGFIENVKVMTEGKKRFMRIHLKYINGNKPAIQGLRRISKPGLRVYRGGDEIPRVQGGLGVSIVSTSKGVLTDRKAGPLLPQITLARFQGRFGTLRTAPGSARLATPRWFRSLRSFQIHEGTRSAVQRSPVLNLCVCRERSVRGFHARSPCRDWARALSPNLAAESVYHECLP